MKLKQFEHCNGYVFKLIFNNDEIRETNLEPLIGDYVSLKNIQTARIDPEWGCLEFNAGMVDIEPKTLYRFSSYKKDEFPNNKNCLEEMK